MTPPFFPAERPGNPSALPARPPHLVVRGTRHQWLHMGGQPRKQVHQCTRHDARRILGALNCVPVASEGQQEVLGAIVVQQLA